MKIYPMLFLSRQSVNSFKPAMVVRHVGAAVNVKYPGVQAGGALDSEFLDINPRGVVPFLKLPDGTTITESNAIAWYFAEGTDLLPVTALGRAQSVCWINFEQTQLAANLSPARLHSSTASEFSAQDASRLPIWRERGNAALSVLNQHLSGKSFICDMGFSVADIIVFSCTHLAGEGGFSLGDYPAICQWIERVGNETGYLLMDELLDGNDVFPVNDVE